MNTTGADAREPSLRLEPAARARGTCWRRWPKAKPSSTACWIPTTRGSCGMPCGPWAWTCAKTGRGG